MGKSVQSGEAAQARVFAHDAIPVAIGAINFSKEDSGLTVSNFGTGYVEGEVITLSNGTGTSPVAAKVKVLTVDASGKILTYEVMENTSAASTPYGQGYVLGDTANQTGATVLPGGGAGAGTNFASTVNDIDLPNTEERGACIYIGTTQTSLTVIMESGREVTFKQATQGNFLPIQVTRVVTMATAGANNVLALY
tara:strand:+ start:44 stop:628 length:585 start_codon:yes stop_codon:yes gene_type:complete